MAHKRGISRDESEVFLKEISRHGSIRRACNVAGVTRGWLRLKLMDATFAEAYADAQEDATDRLEDQARAEALDGSEKLLTYMLDALRYKKADTGTGLGAVQPSVTITIGGSKQ